MFFLAALSLGLSSLSPIENLLPTASLPAHPTEHSIATGIPSNDSRIKSSDVLRMLDDVNGARRAAGLAPLVLDARLQQVAQAHAADMIAHRFFGHDSFNGLTPFDRMDRAGVRYQSAGENIALDIDETSANRELERSNEHRQNILDSSYHHIGIAAVRADDGSEIFVQDFTD